LFSSNAEELLAYVYKLLKGVPFFGAIIKNPRLAISDVLSLTFESSYVMEKMFKLLIPLDLYLRTLRSGLAFLCRIDIYQV
jgi:hypothetical protein